MESGLRQCGVGDLAEVRVVVAEARGPFAVFRQGEAGAADAPLLRDVLGRVGPARWTSEHAGQPPVHEQQVAVHVARRVGGEEHRRPRQLRQLPPRPAGARAFSQASKAGSARSGAVSSVAK
jgi:hypothetical protein